MATNKQVTLTVRAVANQALAETQKLRLELERLKGTQEKVGSKLDKLAQQFSNLDPRISGVANILGGSSRLALYGATAAAVVGLEKLSRESLALNDVMRNVPYSIESAKDATGGLVTELELAKLATMANRFEVAKSSKEFSDLAKGGALLGRSLGIETTKAVSDLTVGLSRMSKPILDNLGLQIDTVAANERLAKSLGKTSAELTDAEKRTAFFNETMREIEKKTKGVTLDTSSWSATLQRLTVDLKDGVNMMVEFVGQSEAIGIALRAGVAVATFGISENILWLDQQNEAMRANLTTVRGGAKFWYELSAAELAYDRAVREMDPVLRNHQELMVRIGAIKREEIVTTLELTRAEYDLAQARKDQAVAANAFVDGKRTGKLYAEGAKLGYEVFKLYEGKKEREAEENAKELAIKLGLIEDKGAEERHNKHLRELEKRKRARLKMEQDLRTALDKFSDERAARFDRETDAINTFDRRRTEIGVARGDVDSLDADVAMQERRLQMLQDRKASEEDIQQAYEDLQEARHQRDLGRIEERRQADEDALERNRLFLEEKRKQEEQAAKERAANIARYTALGASTTQAGAMAMVAAYDAQGKGAAKAAGESLIAFGEQTRNMGIGNAAQAMFMLATGNVAQGGPALAAASAQIGAGIIIKRTGKAIRGGGSGGGGSSGPGLTGGGSFGGGSFGGSGGPSTSSTPDKQVDIPPSAMPPTSGNHGPPDDSRITQHNQAASSSMGSTGAGGGNTYHFNVVGSIDEEAAMRISQGLQQHERRAGRLAV